ncbi:MAG: response regulator [Ignavibacteriales bacterium]|nr:response regulator [Ignavibacteriales bacterium]
MKNDNISVLIIDDNPDLIQSQEYILKKAGFKTITAACGIDGLKLAQSTIPDILLLDIAMPDLSGIEILKILKSDPLTKDIFVILITAFLKASDQHVKGLESGADAYLTRPLPAKLFLAQFQVYADHVITLNLFRKSEAKLNEVIRQNPDPMLVVNQEGIIIFSNPAAEESFKSMAPLNGKEFGYPIVAESSTSINLLMGNNEIRSAVLRVTPIDYDRIPAFLCTITDVTHLIRYEEELERLNRLYRVLSIVNKTLMTIDEEEKLIQTIGTIFVENAEFDLVSLLQCPSNLISDEVKHFVFSQNSGKINHSDLLLYVNESMLRDNILTYKKQLIFNSIDNHVLNQYDIHSLGIFPIIVQEEVRFILQLFSKDPVFFDKSEVDLIVEISGDIAFVLQHIESERIRKEDAQQLSEQKELFEKIINTIPVMITRFDPQANVTMVNAEFEKKTGYSNEIVQNVTLMDELYPDGTMRQQVIDYMLRAEIGWKEFRLRKLNGEYLDSIWSNLRLKSGMLIGIGIDLTDKKLIESTIHYAQSKALELSRIKSNLMANMSHELRTPMIGILGYAEILEESATDPNILEMAKIINAGAQRLIETLNLILDYSRLEAEKQVLDFSDFDLVPLAREVISLYGKTAAKKKISILLVSRNKKAIVYADERAFYQILNNLVSNAVKYTLSGSVILAINEIKKDNAEFIEISIKDTGIGIKPENLNFIWQEFRQVSEGIGRNFEGTGLGLANTKKLCDLLAVKINVESEVGVGTTCVLRLPKSEGNLRKKIKEPSSDTELSVLSGERAVVLYVEDEETSFNIVQIQLSGICDVVQAKNSTEALQLLESSQKYSAIFMDINLRQGLDGVQLTQLIRKDPKFALTPIIAITAYAARGDREIFLSEGCTDYIAKPFTRDVLKVWSKNTFFRRNSEEW